MAEEATFFLDPWDIPVPQESLKVTSTKIQLVFVPLFAFDVQGNVGYTFDKKIEIFSIK